MGYRLETRPNGRIVHVAAITSVAGVRREFDRNTPSEALDMIDRFDASIRDDQTLLGFLKFTFEHLELDFSGEPLIAIRARMPHLIKATEIAAPDVTLLSLTQRHFKDIYNALKKSGRAPTTLYRDLGDLARIIAIAMAHGRIETNPARAYIWEHLKRPAACLPDLPRVDPTPTIAPLLTRPSRLGLYLMRYAGLTVSQMPALRWPDIDFGQSTLRVTRTIMKGGGLLIPTNVIATRTIPLNDGPLLDLLRQQYAVAPDKDHGPVVAFLSKRNQIYSPVSARHVVTGEIVQAQHAAGILSVNTKRPYAPFTFRDLCIVDWLNEPRANVVKIQTQAGYSNPKGFLARYQPFIRQDSAAEIIESALSAMAEMR